MAKLNAAGFASKVTVNGVVQDAFTLVMETSLTKTFEAITCLLKTNSDDSLLCYYVHTTYKGNQNIFGDPEFTQAFQSFWLADSSTTELIGTVKDSDIELVKKLDLAFYEKSRAKHFNKPYSLKSKDTNGVKLYDFLKQHFVFKDENIQDFVFDKNCKVYPYAVRKKMRNFNLFWTSPHITNAEKDYCKAKIDLDICMSNSNKDMFKVLTRTLFADYPERKWVFNILFGDPSSGKTTMIENLCAFYNIPFVKLTGDPTISMTKLIMTVGPENVQKEMSKQYFVNKCKAKGMTDAEIQSISNKINELIVSSKEVDIQLTEQESILLKAIKYKLPLLVLLDECNVYATIFMATLADVITSGYVNVGVHTYKDDGHNIMWFGAYNPNTYKCSPFEGKFRDRALFFCSEMPTQDELISHKQRKVRASLFGSSAALSSISEQVGELINQHPEFTEKFNEAFSLLNNICLNSTPSPEAVQWYFDKTVGDILNNETLTFTEEKFTNYFFGDVSLADEAKVNESVRRILILVDKINEILKPITKGTDSKNPDNNFSFYIPNRAIDYYMDLVFCFRSVRKATEFIVYNLIPNGDTIRYGTSSNPGADIAKSVCSSLKEDIDDLQNYLFTNINDAEVNSQLVYILVSTTIKDEFLNACKSIKNDGVSVKEETPIPVAAPTSSGEDILNELEDIQ